MSPLNPKLDVLLHELLWEQLDRMVGAWPYRIHCHE
jgi:hypothetical protein